MKIPKGGNQNPYIEEEQTTQWPKGKVQKERNVSVTSTFILNYISVFMYLLMESIKCLVLLLQTNRILIFLIELGNVYKGEL